MADVTRFIERAEQEVKRKNYDEAIRQFRQILEIDPDCGEARSGIRMAAIKKFEKRYPSAAERGLLNFPASLCLGLAKLFKAKSWTINLCEDALRRDPKNPKLNHKLGHALLELGHAKSAEAAFRTVTEFDQKDAESLKILGKLYADRKELQKAIECYERALKINPRDQEAGKMRKNLAAEGAIQQGGYEQARSSRELAKSDRQMKEAERAQKIVRTSDDMAEAVAECERELAASPDDQKLLLRLGALHQQSESWDRALETLQKLLKLAPEHAEAEDRLGDVRMRRFELQIAEAEVDVKAGEDGADDRLRRLRREAQGFQLAEFQRRVRHNPTDMGLRFKLGRALFKEGQIDDAIQHFQLAVKDPKHKVPTLQALGRAFAQKGLTDLAIKQFNEAAEKVGGMTDLKKEILFELAEIHEKTEQKDQAVAVYQQILEADINYRDVRARLDRMRS